MNFAEMADAEPGFLFGVVVEIDGGLFVAVFAEDGDLFTGINEVNLGSRPLVFAGSIFFTRAEGNVFIVVEKGEESFFLFG